MTSHWTDGVQGCCCLVLVQSVCCYYHSAFPLVGVYVPFWGVWRLALRPVVIPQKHCLVTDYCGKVLTVVSMLHVQNWRFFFFWGNSGHLCTYINEGR